jgi:hypothetical protein
MLDALKALIAVLLAEGGLLVLLILGIVQAIKQFGVKDQVARIANIIVGLVMGFLIALGSKGVPTDVQGWVVLILFCLLCSLVASGIYHVATDQPTT